MRVLLIGKNSYIGEHIRDYLKSFNHQVEEFDAEHEDLTEETFSGFDSVIHLAAIVHRKDITDYSIYKKVNVVLPVTAASLAKKSGIKQFVFFSTMAVYNGGKALEGNIVDCNTECIPETFYGKSKLEAELALHELESDDFKIAYIRPANVYGKNCRGAYISSFAKIVKLLPIIPDAYQDVKQGMLYIDNLSELVRLIVEKNGAGIFPAQDNPAVSSVEIMEAMSSALNLNKKKSKLLGVPFKLFKIGMVNKLYGGISYAKEYSETELGSYNKISFEESMKITLS